jgi:polyhydroxybutyrate depolymerase
VKAKTIFLALMLAGSLLLPGQEKAERKTIPVGDLQRTYLIHTPAGWKAGPPGPLVLAFHGYTDDAAFHEQQTHFNRVSDQYNFTVVYGEGIEGAWHLPGFKSKDRKPIKPEEDVAYVKAIIDRLVADKVADPSAVYSTGYSNGGYFSLYLALVLNDRLAAIAPVSGGITFLVKDVYKLPRPIPVLMIHGTEDKLVPYAGRPQDLMPAEECAAFLARINGAAAQTTRTALPDVDPNDGTTSTLIEYAGPVPVQLIRIEGGGHEWPNFLPHPQDREWLGHMSRDFDASELIWKFFARFHCPVVRSEGVAAEIK